MKIQSIKLGGEERGGAGGGDQQHDILEHFEHPGALGSEEGGGAGGGDLQLNILEHLEQACACGHGGPRDDGLAHACDLVDGPVQGRIEQHVRDLFKGCQHEHALLHLLDAEACDPQDLALHRA